MIVVTGGAGFIGSNLLKGLNARGIDDILVVDDLLEGDKFHNLAPYRIADYMDKDDFRARLSAGALPKIEAIFHQGACSDTTVRDGRYMLDNCYRVSLELLDYATAHIIPLLYASSPAVSDTGPDYLEDPS